MGFASQHGGNEGSLRVIRPRPQRAEREELGQAAQTMNLRRVSHDAAAVCTRDRQELVFTAFHSAYLPLR